MPVPGSLLLLGTQHQLRPHMSIKLLLAERLELHRAFFKRKPLFVRVLGDFGRHVVADDGVETGDEHQAVFVC